MTTQHPERTQSPAEMLATLLIGEPVGQWINRRRREGATLRILARELYERTGGKLDVTQKTLAAWQTTDHAA